MKFHFGIVTVAVASLVLPYSALGQTANPEGPFIDGVFSRPLEPSSPPATSLFDITDAVAPAIYDRDGNSNELIVAFR